MYKGLNCKDMLKKIDWGSIFMLVMLLFHLFLSNTYDNWSSFSQLLMRGDAYSHYCTEDQQKGISLPGGRCDEQRLYVSKILPIMRFSNFIFSSIAGLVYDRFGSMFTSSLGVIFILLAWLFFGLLIRYDWCIIMGSIFYGLSVDSLNFPAFEIKYRFPKSANIVLSIGGAAASAGAGISIILNYILQKTGFSYRGVTLTYAFVLFPIDWVMITGVFYRLKMTKQLLSIQDHAEKQEEGKVDSDITLWRCIKTFDFLCISLYFFVVNFTLTYHQYFINATYSVDSLTVRILEFAFVASFIPCIILGVFVERYGIILLLIMLNFFGILVPIASLYPNEVSGVFIAFCIMMMYSMFTTPVLCFVQARYPKHVFGGMSGIVFTIGGCAAMLCHPLFELCTTSKIRFNVNILMIFIRALMFIPLGYILKAKNSLIGK